jgi:cytochrome bd ubiquinol oxidase subunit II
MKPIVRDLCRLVLLVPENDRLQLRPNAYHSAAAISAVITGTGARKAILGNYELLPFAGAIGLFLMSFIGIAISLWPMIVPYHYTLWQAASSQSTQAFLLIGTLFLLPIILMYTAWSYWVFRGKVRGDIGYH